MQFKKLPSSIGGLSIKFYSAISMSDCFFSPTLLLLLYLFLLLLLRFDLIQLVYFSMNKSTRMQMTSSCSIFALNNTIFIKNTRTSIVPFWSLLLQLFAANNTQMAILQQCNSNSLLVNFPFKSESEFYIIQCC